MVRLRKKQMKKRYTRVQLNFLALNSDTLLKSVVYLAEHDNCAEDIFYDI